MIVLALLVYVAFVEGAQVAPLLFIMAGVFDLAMAEEIFSEG